MKLLGSLSLLALLTTVLGQKLRGSDDIEHRFLQEVVQQGCKPLRPHTTCNALAARPTCMPYRSTDYCPDDESFPLLIQKRTSQYRNNPAQTWADGQWFFTLENKVAGYTFTTQAGLRAPEMYLCSDDINQLDIYNFPTTKGFVIKASHLHSNLAVFAFSEGFGADGKATDLVTGQSFGLADVKTVLAQSNATTFIVEEYIPGVGLGRLPTEYKFHVVNGKVVSVNVVYNRESERCGCWAEVDTEWKRLDKYGCFKPSGTAQADGLCYAIDFAEGEADAYPMKGLNFCDEVPKPDDCQLQDMIKIAEQIYSQVGVYVRVDMFVSSVDDEIVVQEYTTNHANGLRHCSAIEHSSGCIDSCFMGREWKSTGYSLYGGAGGTTPPTGIASWYSAPTQAAQCAIAISYKPQKWETSCIRAPELPPECSFILPDAAGTASRANTAKVDFVANTFADPTVVCVNKTISPELDAIFANATAGKNIQDKTPYHAQIIADNPPLLNTTVAVNVPDAIAGTLDNGATIEVYILVDDDNNPSTPPVYQPSVALYTNQTFVLIAPPSAYLPDGSGKYVATFTIAATSQINCGIIRPTGGTASLQGIATADFGQGVFTDDSEVCVTKTNDPVIQGIFEASTQFSNLQDKLPYEVNIISQLDPVEGSDKLTITMAVPDALAANTEQDATIVPFIRVQSGPNPTDVSFTKVVSTYNPNTQFIEFQLDTSSFLPTDGKFVSIITLGAISPEGCDIIQPTGGKADLENVATVTFDEDAFAQKSEVCIEKATDPLLIAKLLQETSDPDKNIQDTSPYLVNITSQLAPADTSAVSVVVPPNLVELTQSGASISAFVLTDGDNDPSTPPTFTEITATFNPNTGRASFVIPPEAYLLNSDGEYEATVVLAATSPPGCEVLGPLGGTASTPGVGSVTFQAGALGKNSEVCVKTSNTPVNQMLFNNSIIKSGLNVEEELPYDVEVTTTVPPAPGTTSSVTLTVPPVLSDLVDNGASIVAFVLVDDDGNATTPATFVTVVGTFNATSGGITFDLPAGAFFPPSTEGEPYVATLTLAAVSKNNCEIIDETGGTASLEGVASATFAAGAFDQDTQVCITNGTDPYISDIFTNSTSGLNLGGPTSDQINITSQFPPDPSAVVPVTVSVPTDVSDTIDHGGVITGFVMIPSSDPNEPPTFIAVPGIFNSITGEFEFNIPGNAFIPDGMGGYTATVIVGTVFEPGCTIIGTEGGTASLEGVGSATFTGGAFAEDTGVCVENGGPGGPLLNSAISGLNVQDVLPERVNVTSQSQPAPGTTATFRVDVSPEIASAATSGAMIQALVLVETGNPSNPLAYQIVNGTFDPTTQEFVFPVGPNAFLPNGEGGFTSTVTLITIAQKGCDIVGGLGGTVDLVNVANATFAAGVFSSDTEVCITTSDLPSIQQIFDDSTADINIQTESPYEINVEAAAPPKEGSTATVAVHVPPSVADDVDDGATIFAYVLTDDDGNPSTPPVFTQVSGVFDAVNKILTFGVTSSQFLEPAIEGGDYVATIIVASSSPQGCEIIGTSGGSVMTAGVGSASIRMGTFSEDTEVCLFNGTDPVIGEYRTAAVTKYSLEGQLPYHVNLTANGAPSNTSTTRFNLTVPDDLASLGVVLQSSIQAFVLVDGDGDPSTPPSFQPVAGDYDPTTKTIVFDVPGGFFFPPMTPDGEWTTVITLGAVPLASSTPSLSHQPSLAGSASPSLSHQPSSSPVPSATPSMTPSRSPAPSSTPSKAPSTSQSPSDLPSVVPTRSPAPSRAPSSEPSGTPSMSPTLSQVPSSSPTTNGCGIIDTSGGEIQYINGNVTATYGPNAYNKASGVCITTTADPYIDQIYQDSTVLFRPLARLPYEVRIGTEFAPVGPHNVSVQVPVSFAALVGLTYDIQLFAVVNTDGTQRLQQLQGKPAYYNRDTQRLEFELSPFYYLPSNDAGGSPAGGFPLEAVFTLAITPGAGCDGPCTSDPLSNETCLAASLRCPVDDGVGGDTCDNATQPYYEPRDGKVRLGVDFETKLGDRILAASPGKIEFIGQLALFEGISVVLRHTEMSATLYARLATTVVNVGDDLLADEQIGTAMDGGLYFEYAPNGELYKTRFRIDPLPCIGLVAEGSVLVGDDGNYADDSFEILIDGTSVGRTPTGDRGINFGVSNLRPGRHSLEVLIREAPDAHGTYYIRLRDGVYFVDESNNFLGYNVTVDAFATNRGSSTCDPELFSQVGFPLFMSGCTYESQSYSIYVPKDGEVPQTLAPTPTPGRRVLVDPEEETDARETVVNVRSLRGGGSNGVPPPPSRVARDVVVRL